ncbi:MAG: acyltransferase family protein, partial [Acidimicrobiia bacterium]
MNAAALLAGCYLAVVHLHSQLRWRLPVWPLAALAAMSTVFATDTDAFLWATLATVALSALAVGVAVGGSRPVEGPWLMWIGKVSYGIYLCHVLMLVIPWPGPEPLLGLVATAVMTALSWLVVEQPALRLKGESASAHRQRMETATATA